MGPLATEPNRSTKERYTIDVVRMAPMVPTGIEAAALAKSPDLLLPAIIPVQEGKKIPVRTIMEVAMSAFTEAVSAEIFSLIPGTTSPFRR